MLGPNREAQPRGADSQAVQLSTCITVVPHQEWKACDFQEVKSFCPLLSQEQSEKERKLCC